MISMEDVVSLYAEVRKRIGVVHVVVFVGNRYSASKVHTEVHPTSIEVDLPEDDYKRTFNLPDFIRLNPKSCQGLHWVRGEGIHMRLQMVSDDQQDVDADGDDDRDVSIAMEMEAMRQSEMIMFGCVACKGSLFPSSRSFSRVLPLPSENWREMSSDWCCHGNEYTQSLGQSSLAPKEADCLMSELYLSIHPASLDQKSVIMEDTEMSQSNKRSKVQCRRCRQVLGEAFFKGAPPADEINHWSHTQNVHLYKHCILVKDVKQHQQSGEDVSSNILRNYSLEVFLSNHFVSLSKTQMSFKFIVESADDNEAVLLVWLLSSDTILLSSGPSSSNVSWEPFRGSTSDDDNKDSVKEQNPDVKYFKIAKILYQHRKDETFGSTLEEWKRDFGVETVRLPTHSCLELLLLLTTSTQHTPESLRAMEGFQVGYLRISRDSSENHT